MSDDIFPMNSSRMCLTGSISSKLLLLNNLQMLALYTSILAFATFHTLSHDSLNDTTTFRVPNHDSPPSWSCLDAFSHVVECVLLLQKDNVIHQALLDSWGESGNLCTINALLTVPLDTLTITYGRTSDA
jgi:hypothetical protein